MKRHELCNFRAWIGAAWFALILTPMLVTAQDYSALKSNGNLQLRGYGTFFVAGTPITVDAKAQAPGRQPGVTVINQMHVQFMLPQLPKGGKGRRHAPIVFVHGGGLSSKSWQTTPDGRMGWDEYFVRKGFDIYLVDQVSRGRSGFDATKYNMVRNGAAPNTAQATILVPTDQLAWQQFRWGNCTVSPCATTTTPNPGIRFPMNTVGVGPGANLQFYNQDIPDMLGALPNPSSPDCSGSGCAPADPGAPWATPSQMAELARQLGGAVLVGHSESSSMPIRAALQPAAGCYPYTTAAACKVRGLIQLETGCFGNLTPAQVNTLAKIPILIVFADFSPVQQPAAPCPAMIAQLRAAGGDIKFAWLPQLVPDDIYRGSPGPMPGFDHMMMLDHDNLKVADLLMGWAASRGL